MPSVLSVKQIAPPLSSEIGLLKMQRVTEEDKENSLSSCGHFCFCAGRNSSVIIYTIRIFCSCVGNMMGVFISHTVSEGRIRRNDVLYWYFYLLLFFIFIFNFYFIIYFLFLLENLLFIVIFNFYFIIYCLFLFFIFIL